MTQKTIFIISAVIITLSGVGTILSPQLMFDLWGAQASPAGLILTRLGGALEVGLGVILWLARNAAPSDTRRAIVIGGLVCYGLLFLVMCFSQFSGVVNATGWLNVLLYLLLALGFGYLLVAKK